MQICPILAGPITFVLGNGLTVFEKQVRQLDRFLELMISKCTLKTN